MLYYRHKQSSKKGGDSVINIELLRQIISDSGLSISWIASKLGISRQALYNKLHRKTEFKPSEIAILVQILHIGKNQIF